MTKRQFVEVDEQRRGRMDSIGVHVAAAKGQEILSIRLCRRSEASISPTASNNSARDA